MTAKSKKIHGFRVTSTLFFPYDPAKPESITAASTLAEKLKGDLEAAYRPGELVIEKITPPVGTAISAPEVK